MTGKRLYRVGTHVGPEYRRAFTARQALWLVWNAYRGIGCKVSWGQAENGWSVEEMP